MFLWRISNFADLSGKGGLVADGRWHSRGNPVLYCSEHPAVAMLEVLVHINPATAPDDFQLIQIDCPDDIAVFAPTVSASHLRDEGWTRQTGNEFLSGGDCCLMRIPSAVMPLASNIIVNPLHADAARLAVISVDRHPFDNRLFRR